MRALCNPWCQKENHGKIIIIIPIFRITKKIILLNYITHWSKQYFWIFFYNAIESEWNLSNIEETIFIDISTKPDTVENIHVGVYYSSSELETYFSLFHEFHDVFSWYYEEIPCIDTSIVEHTINMYPDVKSLC